MRLLLLSKNIRLNERRMNDELRATNELRGESDERRNNELLVMKIQLRL